MLDRSITREEVRNIANRLLLDFQRLSGFEDATIAEIRPIYGYRGGNIEYYEVKFSSNQRRDNGYTIISVTTRDLPVLEFSEDGLTYFQRFQNMTGRDDFKMIWFGPNYITAEDSRGNLLAEIGNRSIIIPEESKRHSRGEGKSATGEIQKIHTPEFILRRKGEKAAPISYDLFKERYSRPIIKADALERAWTRALRPRGNPGCEYAFFIADGFPNHPYFLQIKKNTPPNNNDHASGCGPTAWMNLCGWHDQNWTPQLIGGSHKYNDAYLNNLTMQWHDFLGTYEPWWTFGSDQGFTWPGDMGKGMEFIRQYFSHACSYWWRYDWWDTDENWVFAAARDLIRANRPFIVGYFQDWHYAIGYEVAECMSHGWENHSWIKIYPAWTTSDNQNKWIPKRVFKKFVHGR